ncbi:MAG: FAD-binding oxidoreductase [Patescibacteria group bacterium]
MKEEILKFFRGVADDRPETLDKYSKDASIFEVRPKLVLYPLDSDDVVNLVEWVSKNKEKYPDLSITARCAGTDMSGGAIGESIVLDFTKYMNKLVSFSGDEITVEPGMLYRDFEEITLKRGLILPTYTASKSLNAMGGMFGNNAAGEKTLKYGKTEKFIVRTKVVFADGSERTVEAFPLAELASKDEIYKKIYSLIKANEEEIRLAKPDVHKNSAGYYLWNVMRDNVFDLNRLLVGSQGTLGIATEITFKLVPIEKYSKLVVIFMRDLEPLGRLVGEILESKPETLEAYDDKTLWLAVRFFREFLKKKTLVEAFKFFKVFLPEFLMVLRGGFPKLVVLAEFSGTSERETDDKCRAMTKNIANFKMKIHITKDRDEAEKFWSIRRESFNLLRKHIKGKRTAPFVDDIIVRPEFLSKFLPELNQILGKYKLVYTIAGHAGDGNFHVIPLMDFSRPDVPEIIHSLSEEVYDLVLRYHGSITAEHNDGLIRTPFLKKMFGERMIGIFRDVKSIFDPKNILNPGKKVPVPGGPGTKEYITSHIALEHPGNHGI